MRASGFAALSAAVILTAEVLALSVWVDGQALVGRAGLAGVIGVSGAYLLRALVAFAASLVAFTGLEGKLGIVASLFGSDRAFAEGNSRRRQLQMLLVHLSLAILFVWATSVVYHPVDGAHNVLAMIWLALGAASVAALALVAATVRTWLATAVITRGPALYACIVAAATVALTSLSRSLWQSTARLTFRLVAWILAPIYPTLILQPEILRVRAPRFGVLIDQACSGLEGAGLMVVFLLVWLYISRRDFRFPRALLLIPAGVVVLYLLNAVRIAALIVIGNSGAPAIALGGFHSQAGWIAFNGVALGMTLVVPRFGWFHIRPQTEAGIPSFSGNWIRDNSTAIYLLPFLAIIAAGMLSRAASAGFEWLYGLRLLAATATLWAFRHQLRADASQTNTWRFSWFGPVAGIAVFAVWLGLDRLIGISPSPMPMALSSAREIPRIVWLVVRTLAAVSTVPIAEELAFRGFLMRRFDSPEFETVSFAKTSLAGIAISSLIFGALHGERWIAGVFAGFVYAVAARRTGRIGESIAAHSTTNLLLAIWVIVFHQYQYW